MEKYAEIREYIKANQMYIAEGLYDIGFIGENGISSAVQIRVEKAEDVQERAESLAAQFDAFREKNGYEKDIVDYVNRIG